MVRKSEQNYLTDPGNGGCPKRSTFKGETKTGGGMGENQKKGRLGGKKH